MLLSEERVFFWDAVCLGTKRFTCMLYFLISPPQSRPHFIDEEDEGQNKLPKVTQSELESESRYGPLWSPKHEFLASIKVEAY